MKGQEIRVLLIEDEPDHATLVKTWLAEAIGHWIRVDHCCDYANGLQTLLRQEHDVCLLDYRLGKDDGLQLLEQAVAKGCCVPVIVMTAQGNRDIDFLAAQTGAADYLDKSMLNAEILERSIRFAISTHRLEGERARLVSLLEATTDFVGTMDARTGHITFMNQGGREMVGIGASENVTCLRPEDFHSPAALALLEKEAYPAAAARGVWTGEVPFVHRDGREIPAWMVLVAHRDVERNVEYYSTVSRDLTTRNQAQAEIAALASFADENVSPVLRLDVTGRVLYANDAAGRLLQPWEITIGRTAPDEILQLMRQTVESKAVAQAEVDVNKYSFLVTASQVPKDGYVNVYFADITDRRKAEARLKATEEQFRQSQKLEAVGQLAGGVAHDFNNILTIINGYCDLLLQRDADCDPGEEGLEIIKEAAERAASLTRQLLAFSRKQVLAPEIVDLNAIVQEVEGMLRRLIGEDVQLITRLDESLGKAKIDPGQMQQVLLNLAVNARDAMPQGGNLTLETRSVLVDETNSTRHWEIRPGRYLRLAVNDTGCGIEKETQPRIFEPFFSTKPEGAGTGLGLSTVFGIVTQSGGRIFVDSEPGKGTTFCIYLPDALQKDGDASNRATHYRCSGGTETILLVEDECEVRNVAMRMLQARGYHVLEAGSGEDALNLAAGYEGTIDLLLTDVVMPHMSGRELAAQLSPARPSMKVLYMSGYTDDAVVRHGVLEANVSFIQKPLFAAEFRKKVREAIDGRAHAVAARRAAVEPAVT